MKALSGRELDALEAMVDRASVRGVLDGLSQICAGKAEHLSSNWQDEYAAKLFLAAGRVVDRAANQGAVRAVSD